MPVLTPASIRTLLLASLAGFGLGYADEAAAINRSPAVVRPAGGAYPGYGAERSGAGAEGQYYGAENVRPLSGALGVGDAYGGARFRENGSLIEYDDALPLGREGADGFVSPFGVNDSRAGVYPGFDDSADGSFIYLDGRGQRQTSGPSGIPAGPKIIDVATERLDRRSVKEGGVEVLYVGGAKIIRIASDYNKRSGSTDGSSKSQSTRAVLEPWSEGWERYCTRTHPDFDPNRGTFVSDDGSTRFCTGD